MSGEIATGQRQVCAIHQIHLKTNGLSSRMECPVCEQLYNQSSMSRRGRR